MAKIVGTGPLATTRRLLRAVKQWPEVLYYEGVCGVHSGIPWCCVLWFVTGDHVLTATTNMKDPTSLAGRYRKWARRHDAKPWAKYIRCPACVLRNVRAAPTVPLSCDPATCPRKVMIYAYKASQPATKEHT